MCCTKLRINTVAKVSDEALGLLLLENSWDRWSWEYGKTKVEILADAQDQKPQCPATKYTIGRGRKCMRHSGS